MSRGFARTTPPNHQFHTKPKAGRSISCRISSPTFPRPLGSFDAWKEGLMGPSSAPWACSSEGVGGGSPKGRGQEDLPNRRFSHICGQCNPY